MVQKIVWTQQAVDNLQEIQNYIALDSIFYAERTVYILYESVKKLKIYPEIGMVIPNKSKFTIRRILIKTFKIIYCLHLDTIFIIAVYKQSRQLPNDYNFVEDYF